MSKITLVHIITWPPFHLVLLTPSLFPLPPQWLSKDEKTSQQVPRPSWGHQETWCPSSLPGQRVGTKGLAGTALHMSIIPKSAKVTSLPPFPSFVNFINLHLASHPYFQHDNDNRTVLTLWLEEFLFFVCCAGSSPHRKKRKCTETTRKTRVCSRMLIPSFWRYSKAAVFCWDVGKHGTTEHWNYKI